VAHVHPVVFEFLKDRLRFKYKQIIIAKKIFERGHGWRHIVEAKPDKAPWNVSLKQVNKSSSNYLRPDADRSSSKGMLTRMTLKSETKVMT
jgi:hypothetical protein